MKEESQRKKLRTKKFTRTKKVASAREVSFPRLLLQMHKDKHP